jgi:hypothetical protein
VKDSEAISALDLTELYLSVSSNITPEYVSKVIAHCSSIECLSLEGFRGELPKLDCPRVRTLYLRENLLNRTLTMNCPLIEGKTTFYTFSLF